nr:MAG TPA: tail protein [Caudoviricetes sp.]
MVIYDIHNNKILDATLTEGAEHEQELGRSDLVRLSWQSGVKLTLPAGAYIIPFDDGLKYRLLNAYTPTEDDKGFKYTPEFQHPLMWLSRVPFLYDTTDTEKNPIKQQEWSFDGLTTNALEYACKAINEALGLTDNKFTYTLCGNVDASVSFSVSSNDILSVLSSIAQACKNNYCEWHISWEHRALYFGQISINLGESVPTLKVHENIQKASVSDSKEPYYNCFYPQGSTKNMSTKALVGTGNVATLARLGLDKSVYPDGYIYVDTDGNVITKEAFESSGEIKQTLALSFDDVYPHIDLYVYNVRKHVRYLKNSQTNTIELDSRGNKKTYTIWYMRLAFPSTSKIAGKTAINITHDKDESGNIITHYWYDYEIDPKKQVLQGYTLKGIFKVNTHAVDGQYDALTQGLVGQPNGQEGFELHYHEVNNPITPKPNEGDSGVDILKGDYEILKYQSGDTIIPTNESEGLYPRGNALPDLTCNMVVLFNIVMGEQETKLAQEELAARTIKEIKRRAQDNNNYSFASNAVAFANKNPKLYIGQKVTFDDGFGYQLKTRVIRLVTKLDYPIIQEITVGNQAVKGTISQLKEDVNNILSGNFSGGGLNSAQTSELVKNYVDSRFLRKDTIDTAQDVITFLKGVSFNNGGIDGEGRAELISVILETIKSYNFDSTTESGFGITKRKDGKYQLSITDLIVWGKATFNELEKRKLSYVGGNMVFSSCGSKIKAVVPISADGQEIVEKSHSLLKAHNKTITANGQLLYYTRAKKRSANVKIAAYRCYFYQDDGTTATTNLWEAGDQARCQTFNIKDGAYQGVSNRKYWRLVKNVGNDYIDLSVDDCEEESDIPQVGDALVQFGSRTNTDRMSLIYVVVNGDEAPAIIWYDKVNSYTLEGKKTAIISPKEVTFHTRMFNLLNDDGTTESISSIKQTTENIQLEVRQQMFGGANLLKGASLRPLNLLSLQRSEYVTIGTQVSNAHRGNSYLSIVRRGATQLEYNGCKFPVINIDRDKKYTFSMFTRIFGEDKPYLELKLSKQKDMSNARAIYQDIPSTTGKWKQYSYTFDVDDNEYIQIFIGLKRDGEAFFSEIQLEEGGKATSWKDPDVVESIKRAGVNITLGRIEARADNFVIRNSEGKLTTAIDENGQLIAGSLRTQDRGNGYMTLEGNQQSFFKHGIPHPMRWIGYTSEGWVERMYDDVGNLIWENGVNGQIFKMRPERWEDIASHVIVHGISTLDYFFNIHGANALSKIFQSNKDEQYNVYKYHAARDVRGTIIATSQTNPIQSVRDSDGVLFSQKDIKGTKFSGIIRTNIITLCTVNFRGNNSSATIEEDQEERRSLEIAADFIRSRIEELRKKFSLYNTYNVEVRIGVPLYCTQIAVYKDGILTGDYYLYGNEKDVNKNNLNM